MCSQFYSEWRATFKSLPLRSEPRFSGWLCSASLHRFITLILVSGPHRTRRIPSLKSLPFSGWLRFDISRMRLVRPLTARTHIDTRPYAGPSPVACAHFAMMRFREAYFVAPGAVRLQRSALELGGVLTRPYL